MKDITKFSKITDYLPIFTGIIIVEFLTIFIFVGKWNESKTLQKWYHDYHIFAIIADVVSVFLGIIISRYLYSSVFKIQTFSLILFLFIVVAVQWTHDILFYLLFTSVPVGKNKVFDLFKEYAKSAGIGAILGDSSIMILSVLLGSFLANFSVNTNFIVLLLFVYFIPYTIYMR